jgi:hypothetical protein
MMRLSEQESDAKTKIVYAALAHAHFALATLRGATISFPEGKAPPDDTTITWPRGRALRAQ